LFPSIGPKAGNTVRSGSCRAGDADRGVPLSSDTRSPSPASRAGYKAPANWGQKARFRSQHVRRSESPWCTCDSTDGPDNVERDASERGYLDIWGLPESGDCQVERRANLARLPEPRHRAVWVLPANARDHGGRCAAHRYPCGTRWLGIQGTIFTD
jgi:hypothetical protein